VRDTVTTIQHDTSGPAAGIQRKDSLQHGNNQSASIKYGPVSFLVGNSTPVSLSYLDRYVHRRDIKCLEHDLRGQDISPAVEQTKSSGIHRSHDNKLNQF
jgi:hypothetical protein